MTAVRAFQIARRMATLRKEYQRLRAELVALSGDEVPDFNDVWGGAGPDC